MALISFMDISLSEHRYLLHSSSRKESAKVKTLPRSRRKKATLCQTPEAMILGGRWKVLSTGADFASVIDIKPSSRTISTHPKCSLAIGDFWGRFLLHGANMVKVWSCACYPRDTI